MENPVIQTDIASILGEIRQDLKGINDRLGKIEVGQAEIKGEIKAVDERLSGQIKAVDERLSGQIKAVDERLSGQIKAVDTKVDQLDKRIGNQEFINRGVFVGLILVILGGAAKFLGIVNNP